MSGNKAMITGLSTLPTLWLLSCQSAIVQCCTVQWVYNVRDGNELVHSMPLTSQVCEIGVSMPFWHEMAQRQLSHTMCALKIQHRHRVSFASFAVVQNCQHTQNTIGKLRILPDWKLNKQHLEIVWFLFRTCVWCVWVYRICIDYRQELNTYVWIRVLATAARLTMCWNIPVLR